MKCIQADESRATMWRCRVAGRARTIGNRVYPIRVSRVRISPSPPQRKPCASTGARLFAAFPGVFLLFIAGTGSGVIMRKTGQNASIPDLLRPIKIPVRMHMSCQDKIQVLQKINCCVIV